MLFMTQKGKRKDRRTENEKASLLNSLNGKYFSCLFDFSSSYHYSSSLIDKDDRMEPKKALLYKR